jgi:hypothetical protein
LQPESAIAQSAKARLPGVRMRDCKARENAIAKRADARLQSPRMRAAE